MSRTLVRVFLLVLVLVAGVSSFSPEASAQLDATWTSSTLTFDVVTASLTSTTSSVQTVTVKSPISRNWDSTRIVACSWTMVEPSSTSFLTTPPTDCRIINDSPSVLAVTLASNITLTTAEISNRGVVVLIANFGTNSRWNFFYSEWVPLPEAIDVNPSTALNLTEQGATGTYNVKLRTQPSGGVKVRVVSSNAAVTVNAGTTADIDFSTTNWNTTQAVTVTAVNDSDQDDETATLTFSTVNASTSADYDNVVNVTRTVNVDDNDGPPGIVTSAVSGSATEAGGTATFTVVLNSEPTANVTIAVSSGDPTEGTVLPASLTFTSGNWNTSKPVTVTGKDDDVDDGNQNYDITLDSSSTDSGYHGLNENVAVTTTDDDVAAVTVDTNLTMPGAQATTLSVTEGATTATFTVQLATEPTAAVTVAVASQDTSEGTATPAALTFTATDWHTAQPVTVTGADDNLVDGDETWAVRVTPSSDDSNYNTPSLSENVAVTTTDDDVAAVTVDTNLTMPGAQATTLSVTEGATTATFTVQLATEPTAAVTVAVASQDTSEGTATPAALTFTATDWHTAQPVTVTGADDDVADRDETWAVRVTPSSGDSNYNTPSLSVDVSVTTTDDDTPGLVINRAELALTEATTDPATHMQTYTVKLASEPTAAVTVTVTDGDTGVVTVAPDHPDIHGCRLGHGADGDGDGGRGRRLPARPAGHADAHGVRGQRIRCHPGGRAPERDRDRGR